MKMVLSKQPSLYGTSLRNISLLAGMFFPYGSPAFAGEPSLYSTKRVSPSSKPNIILILTDQQTASAMSCAGNADVKTPPWMHWQRMDAFLTGHIVLIR
jgi:hypothetical protein